MERFPFASRRGKSRRREDSIIFPHRKTERGASWPSRSVLTLFRAQQDKQKEMAAYAGTAWDNVHNLVFTNAAGSFLSHRTVYDCFKRIVKSIGMETMLFHDLRHSYAVASIKNGDDIKTVQENLGHATAAFTLDVYVHATNQMKKASADRMEQYIQTLQGE
jgi:integrase